MRTFLITALLILSFGTLAVAGEALDINGSTTVEPIIQKAVELYQAQHPDVTLTVSATGSGDGIKALIEGHANIAMASRKIKDKEVTFAEEKGIAPYEIVVGLDALLAVVHPDNPVAALTKEQLQKIYTGEITNWSEVGGPDMDITVFSRESSSGTYGTWQGKVVGKENRVVQSAQMTNSNGSMVEKVANNPKAIGYIGVGYLDERTKAVTVDGVSYEDFANYPLGRTLQLYTNGEPTGVVKDFIDFVLSPEGQEKCVKAAGYLPL